MLNEERLLRVSGISWLVSKQIEEEKFTPPVTKVSDELSVAGKLDALLELEEKPCSQITGEKTATGAMNKLGGCQIMVNNIDGIQVSMFFLLKA